MEITPIPGFSEPFSSITHLLGAVFFLVGGFYLGIKGRGNTKRQVGLGIYSFSLVFLFSMSGVYHLLEPGLMPRHVLRHLDHAGIWILIAGTFTPMHIILFRGVKRWGVLLPVWIMAITGLTLEMVFFNNIPEWLVLSFFLFLGWVGVISIWMFKKYYPEKKYRLIGIGGVAYSLGAVMEFTRWPILWSGVIGPHEIFHIFVLIGAGSHWLFIFRNAHRPKARILVVHIKEFVTQGGYQAIGENELIDLRADSLEELHGLIQSWVNENFHREMRPLEINLKHSKIL
ncbi:MAG: DNA-binding protein [Halobacteriovorax sp.]|nr:DNA-binding protein [Halobacteriovorax sp.]|tara:strand:+ start:143949 stop:144806 length:858 start_codon:yes stop_codon:yes gene_type:complete